MENSDQWYIRTTDGSEYGPAQQDEMMAAAREGRIDGSCLLSKDKSEWLPATSLAALELRWAYEIEGGQLIGPFHRDYIDKLIRQKELPADIHLYCASDHEQETAQIDELKKQLATSRDEHAKLAKTLAEAEARRKDSEARAKDLETRAKDFEAQAKSLEERAKKSDAQITSLTDELKKAQNEITVAKTAIATAQATIVTAQAATVAEQTKGKKLAEELKSAQAATAAEQTKANRLSAELDAARKAKEDETAKVNDLTTKVNDLTSKANDLQQQLAAAKAEREKLAKSLNDELIKAQEEVAVAKTAAATAQAATAAAQAKEQKLSHELNTALLTRANESARVRELQQQLTAEVAHGKELDKALANATAHAMKSAEQVKAAEERTAALAEKLAAAEEKFKELQKAKKSRNPFQALFGSSSASDLAALEQAARREFFALKRPHGAQPQPTAKRHNDAGVIDVEFKPLNP